MSARRLVTVALLIALLSLLVGCGGGGGGNTTATKVSTKSATKQRTSTPTKPATLTPTAVSPNGEPTEPPAQPSPTDTPRPVEQPTSTPPPVGSTTVDVALVEFQMRPSLATAPAGAFNFRAHNDGTIPHDFLVIRTSLPDNALPVDQATYKVDESQVDVVGRLPAIATEDLAELPLSLSSGGYVLICNLATHYSTGMHASFSVQ